MKSAELSWLDGDEYPFESHYFELPMGRMHYVDEGGASGGGPPGGESIGGPPIVFVHGNPGWSYEFRNSIKALSATNRCIAPDHIGFGLSEKPIEWDYLPSSHAENLEEFLDHLDLDRFILAVNDWGGPIGLSYAISRPEKISHLVITNTWMWSVESSPYYRLFSSFAGGPVGRFLIKHFNFFGRVILRQCFVHKERLDPTLYRHLESRTDRKGCWTFPGQIVGSSSWLEELWSKKERLADVPKTFVWGMGDIAFREKELNVWLRAFPEARVVRIEDAGHSPHEEATGTFVEELRRAVEAHH